MKIDLIVEPTQGSQEICTSSSLQKVVASNPVPPPLCQPPPFQTTWDGSVPPGFVSYSKVERVRLEDGSTYVTSFNVDKGRMSFSESVTQTILYRVLVCPQVKLLNKKRIPSHS